MKLIVERDMLALTLKSITRVADRRSSIPILSNALLRAEAEMLTVTATNLTMMASNAIYADISTPGAITVPLPLLETIVNRLPSGAQIGIECDGAAMTLRAGRSRSTLQTLPAADFPDFSESADGHSFTLPAATVERLVNATRFAISTEETRYYLCGMYLTPHGRDGERRLCAVSTDGHRLSRIFAPLPEGMEHMPGVIIPTALVDEIGRMAKDTPGEMSFDVSTAAIRVRSGSADLIGKLVDGTYPDWERAMPSSRPKHARLDVAELASAVTRASAVLDSKSGPARLTLAEGEITVTTTGANGEINETVDAEFDGDATSIIFASGYISTALDAIGSGEIVLGVDTGMDPALITRPDDPEHVITLMPRRM